MAVLPATASADEMIERWETDGWFVLRELIPADQVAMGRTELQQRYPDARSVWREPDPVLKAEQFAGITDFPFAGQTLNHLALAEVAAEVASALLRDRHIVLYMSHAWAKYTGSADYDQLLHRDFRSHTLAVPDQRRLVYAQVEFMLYLSDVTEDVGPTRLVSRRHTGTLPLEPEFLPRAEHPQLYALEESAAAPAGSLLVYGPDVVHRGTNLTRPGGSRFVVAMGYQRRGRAWMGYHSWPRAARYPALIEFLGSASPRQIELLGFPPPDDPYWTHEMVDGVRGRYPGIDIDGYLKWGR